MSRKLDVQHFIANRTTRQYGSNPTSDLLGVDYLVTYPGDAEFPRTVPQFDLFARFFVERMRPTRFIIRVWRLNSRSRNRSRMGSFGPFLVDFRPTDTFRDHGFRLKNVRFEGPGVYAFRLYRGRNHPEKGLVWNLLATEYLSVSQQP